MDTSKNYTFLPWLRLGIAAEITVTDDLGEGLAAGRAETPIGFRINGQPITRQVQLLGPGDVVGISPRAIVRTEPRHRVTDFEANYLPFVEFYDEDFPWRFTPAKAAGTLTQSRLRPWIFLLVLAEGEFDERKSAEPLGAIEIRDDVDPNLPFPPKTQSWAWAHVHVSRNIIGDKLQTSSEQDARLVEQTLQGTLAANSDNACARLLCPRKLKEGTAYHAFIVPAFETGRRAGLGLDTAAVADGQAAAWGDGQTLYPVYYRWSFRTGLKGDFEFLVDLLEPRPVDQRVGVRDMDMQRPEYEVDGMSSPLDVMGLEGALKSPQTESFPPQWPPEDTDFENPADGSPGKFINQLEAKVNLQFDLLQEETPGNPHPDPIVSPPLYGKWYAMAERLEAPTRAGWVNELNRDPRYRVPAGLGVQVIQNNQERFMQQAWSQLGDLAQTNTKIRQLQLAWMTSATIYRKNLLPQSTDRLLQFTRPVQARVLGSPTTIAQQLQASRLPNAAVNAAFRKITRGRGAIMRKAAPQAEQRKRPILTQLNAGKLTAAAPPPAATGLMSVDRLADTIVVPGPPAWLPSWLLLILEFLKAVFGLETHGARIRRQNSLKAALHESGFTPSSVDQVPARPTFVLTEFDQPLPASQGGGAGDSVAAANFRLALKDAFNVYQSPPAPAPVRQPLDMNNAAARLLESLDPAVAIPKRAEFMLRIPLKIKDSFLRPEQTLVTVMAHPVFSEPMYRPLRDISPELLAPNLELIPNNTISLMVTNQPFIEAYMVGLNHEMGCELLWREFQTDQRGSYFRQFWDVGDTLDRNPANTAAQTEEDLLDITRLHTWGRSSALGSHANRPLPTGAEPGEARLVLVIRGDLLKKYPTAVIYAQQARWTKDSQGRDIRELDPGDPDQTIKHPMFKAEIDPDIHFLGFDLTKSEAKGSVDPAVNNPGWYFVIQERPGEPRFGLDNLSDDSPATAGNWDQLAWEHLTNFADLGCIDFSAPIQASITDPTDAQFEWGRNAADIAYILYQVPVMVAFHAADMLAQPETP